MDVTELKWMALLESSRAINWNQSSANCSAKMKTKIKYTLPPVGALSTRTHCGIQSEIKRFSFLPTLKITCLYSFVYTECSRALSFWFSKCFATLIKSNNGFLIQIHTTANISFRFFFLLLTKLNRGISDVFHSIKSICLEKFYASIDKVELVKCVCVFCPYVA